MDHDLEVAAWRYIRYHYCEKRQRLSWLALRADLIADGYPDAVISRFFVALRDGPLAVGDSNTEIFDLTTAGWARMIDLLGERFPGESELIRMATRRLDKLSDEPSALFLPLQTFEHLADQTGVPRDRVERLVVDLARNRGFNLALDPAQGRRDTNPNP